MSDATFLYRCIRWAFDATAGVFYATTEVHGLEHVAPTGTPSIVCFNHGNGLGDPVVLIRKTPRMVRFCAKDALWRAAGFKYFIRNSGAVPVYRAKDHGDKARDLNLEVFSKVIAALRQGDCLGFAPEGVSRFLPYMEQPLKTGVARIALDAVQQVLAEEGRKDFTVHLVPVGLVFTHREKFRSDLCMRYCPPIKVDHAYLESHGGDTRAAAAAITSALNDALESVTINAPDWETTRLAMTASRLHRPVGTDLTLGQYLTGVRGWVEVLKAEAVGGSGGAKIAALRAALSAYQDLLDEKKIKCERVRRAAAQGGQALPWYWCLWGMCQRLAACSLLFALAAPGLLLWMPMWLYVKRQERHLMSKGPRWNDSVAEMKMLTAGCTCIFLSFFGLPGLSLLLRSPYPLLLIPYLYLTMRCYEEAVADARSAYSLYKLLFLTPATMGRMVQLRAAAKAAMDPAIPLLPDGVSDHLHKPADEVRPLSTLDYYFPWWAARLVMLVARRPKKDWNEVLRLSDVPTMDYVR